MSTPPDSSFDFLDPDGDADGRPGADDRGMDGRSADDLGADDLGADGPSAGPEDASAYDFAADGLSELPMDSLSMGGFQAEDFPADEAEDFSISAFDLGGISLDDDAAGAAAAAESFGGVDVEAEDDDVEAFFNPGGVGFGDAGAAFGLYGDDQDAAGTEEDAAEAPMIAPEPAQEDRDRKGKKGRATAGVTLGVSVGTHALQAVLLSVEGGRYDVLRQFSRQRTAMLGDGEEGAIQTPEMDTEADDINFQVGGGAADLGAEDLFLASEFGDLGGDAPEQDFAAGQHRPPRQPIVFELKDLLDECAALGHERPPVSLCTAPDDVTYVEVLIAEKKAPKKGAKAEKAAEPEAPVKRERLIEALVEVSEGPFDKDRVQFVPMTPRDGARRFLAIVPSEEDPIEESLELLREQPGMKAVPFRVHTAEVPTLIGLAAMAFRPAEGESTAIVRVGAEDTLVVLLEGSELHHAEHMRSVTAFDGPDTVCSRVLLQQDVQGIGTVHNVLVVSEEREGELVQGFAAFYPEARVEPLRTGLVGAGVQPPAGKRIAAASLPALGAALAAALGRDKDSPFAEVNMLPKRLRRTRRNVDMAVAWHTLVAGVLLFLAVLFFVGAYFQQEAEIAEAQAAVAAFPAEVTMSSRQLQARIDSLQAAHNRITRGLRTVDSLLVGSDVWSRSLSRTAAATDAVGGVWVDEWQPSGSRLVLTGRATQRGQVVELAERLDGSITELTYTEVRGYPVYAYAMDTPLKYALPEVAVWLREQAAARQAATRPDLPLSAAPSAP